MKADVIHSLAWLAINQYTVIPCKYDTVLYKIIPCLQNLQTIQATSDASSHSALGPSCSWRPAEHILLQLHLHEYRQLLPLEARAGDLGDLKT